MNTKSNHYIRPELDKGLPQIRITFIQEVMGKTSDFEFVNSLEIRHGDI